MKVVILLLNIVGYIYLAIIACGLVGVLVSSYKKFGSAEIGIPEFIVMVLIILPGILFLSVGRLLKKRQLTKKS